ncbi:MAG: hypothetical protein WBG57_13885 [Ornithinimicrobium sp.]
MTEQSTTPHDEDNEVGQINTPPAQTANTDAPKDEQEDQLGGRQVSEAGGSSLNEETNAGGADAVPDAHG